MAFMAICRAESPEGWNSTVLSAALSPLNYLDSSSEKPKTPRPSSGPCQSQSTFNALQSSRSWGSRTQTHQFKICLCSSSYIKVNVNYPLPLSISPASIIHSVIEKHYLNPVLTEIQAPSFPQGRHNWIPPEATDAKCSARGGSGATVVVFRILHVSIFTFLSQRPNKQSLEDSVWESETFS